MKNRIRRLYEDEAVLRQDALSKIYNGDTDALKGQIPLWAAYLLRLKQIWLENILSGYIRKDYLILDVGCGSGYLSGKFKGRCRNLYGVDISLGYLKIASVKNNSCNFIQADMENLPFKDKAFDIIVCSEVLEHALDWERAVLEIRRVAKKMFISTVPLMPEFLDRLRLKLQKDRVFSPGKGHLRNFQVSLYLDSLARNGFKIVSKQGMGFLWWILPGFMRMAGMDSARISKIDYFFSNIPIFRPLLLDLGVISEL